MSYRFGAVAHEQGVTFRVWAPAQSAVALALDGGGDRAMCRDADGFFTLDVPEARPGQRYWFRLSQGLRPDPASRFQPEGPLEASQIVDTRAYAWRDAAWRGAPPRHRNVLYEMHIGTFTREGTWDAATARLARLADLGVTTLEVMPLAEFAGAFGWGYDGVNLFAPFHVYGGPHDVQRFVDEAHRHGLAVILDVVYNHFGPVGNYSRDFSDTILGPPGEWGDSLNFDGEGSARVREFVVENAAYWIREYHFDGLRLDATQGISDTSPEHVIAEVCRAARAAAGGRSILIVGESEPQDTRLLRGTGAYGDGLDAIWNEDWHHAAFVALNGRREAYFTDYQGVASEFASMARHGTLYQGQWYSWQQAPRGGFALGLPSSCFIAFLENHDQVANTGLGTRLSHQVDRARWRAMTAFLLLGPGIPMLFQGQEYGSSRGFGYFAAHDDELGEAVRKGRMEFLSQFPSLAAPEMRDRIPSPNQRSTFEASKLDDAEREADSPLLHLHRDLLALRRSDPVFAELGTEAVRIESSAPEPGVLLLRYLSVRGERLLVINFADDYESPMNDPLYASTPGTRWSQLWSSEDPRYGGGGVAPLPVKGRWLLRGGTATLLGLRPC